MIASIFRISQFFSACLHARASGQGNDLQWRGGDLSPYVIGVSGPGVADSLTTIEVMNFLEVADTLWACRKYAGTPAGSSLLQLEAALGRLDKALKEGDLPLGTRTDLAEAKLIAKALQFQLASDLSKARPDPPRRKT